MRRFMPFLALAVAACAPLAVHAQVVAVQLTRSYTPVIVQPSYLPPLYYPQLNAYNIYPVIAPSYASTLNLYPQFPRTYTYVAMPIAPFPAPAPGIYSASYSTSSGFGPFRPRASFSQLYYYP